MNCCSVSTEDRIKEAARGVFVEKGFDGTTTRDIAKAAGINSALMNYYFRSKDKLFQAIFDDMSRLMFKGLYEVIDQPTGLREKILALIDVQFQSMVKNPNLTLFIMNELHHNPDRLFSTIGLAKRVLESAFREQVDEEIASGTIRPISAQHIMTLIIANTHFLFVNKPVLSLANGLDENGFTRFADQHLNHAKAMITGYIFSLRPTA